MTTDHTEPTTGAAFEFEAHTLTAAQQIRATALRVAADWCVNNGDLDEVLDIADRWTDWLANGTRDVTAPECSSCAVLARRLTEQARAAGLLPAADTAEESTDV